MSRTQPPSPDKQPEPLPQCLDDLPTAIAAFSFAPPHSLLYGNARFVRLFGELPMESATLTLWAERAWPDPDDRAPIQAWWDETLRLLAAQEGEGPVEVIPREFSITRLDGGILWMVISASRSDDQPVIFLVEVPDHAGDGPRFQERERDRQILSILEKVPIGIFKSTPAGHFVYVNPALATMLGFD